MIWKIDFKIICCVDIYNILELCDLVNVREFCLDHNCITVTDNLFFLRFINVDVHPYSLCDNIMCEKLDYFQKLIYILQNPDECIIIEEIPTDTVC